MDAFAVSICKGLSLGKITKKHMAIAGAWFGGFQALMPLIGYFLGSFFADMITKYAHWIAFVLLIIIGGNMIKEAMGEDEKVTQPIKLTAGTICTFKNAKVTPTASASILVAIAKRNISFASIQASTFSSSPIASLIMFPPIIISSTNAIQCAYFVIISAKKLPRKNHKEAYGYCRCVVWRLSGTDAAYRIFPR